MHRHAALDVGEIPGRSVNPRVSSDHVALCQRQAGCHAVGAASCPGASRCASTQVSRKGSEPMSSTIEALFPNQQGAADSVVSALNHQEILVALSALVADRHRAAPAPPELLGLVEGYVLEAFTEVFGLPLHRVAGPEEDRDGPPR